MKISNATFRLISIFILIILSSTLISCESMIEVDLPNNKLTKHDVFKDEPTAKAALNYLYSKLYNTNFLSKGPTGISYNLSLYTDELTHLTNSIDPFYSNSVNDNTPINTGWWNSSYQDIYSINAFIESTTNSSTLSENVKKRLTAEALTIRAIYYQYLTQLFGAIPYVIITDYNFNSSIGKTSSEKILEQTEIDLLEAIEHLDVSYNTNDRVNINKYTAMLILAQNYLLQNKYDLAEFYSDEIIKSPLYKLEDIANVFKKESMGTLLYVNTLNVPTLEASLYQFQTLSSTAAEISPSLYNLFENNDLRKQHWILPFTINNQDYNQVFKYKNRLNNTDEFSILYRLEEAYFIRCEALINQQKVPEAIDLLNIIRNKRGLVNLPNTLNQNEYITELLNELSREFFTESGHRFFSLKRFEKLNNLSHFKPNWQVYHNLFPLPESELKINTNLLPNNPGY